MPDICYDTEFLDDGRTIELISIGLVAGQRLYYAVNSDIDFERVREHDWLWENVVRHLPTTKTDWDDPQQGRYVTRLDPTDRHVKPKWVIANEVRDFILHDYIQSGGDKATLPKLWAYYGAYDHVALAQLWGPMSKLPEGIPMWTHDLMQFWERFPGVDRPHLFESSAHDALADAQWAARFLHRLQERETAAVTL